MNLRQLKAFQAVCRTGSITRASELIHLSQPALTRQIQELESYCGCKLFERTRHGIVLTDEGELLQVRAEEMLSLAERTRRELKEAGGFTAASSGSAALNPLLRRNFHSSSRSGSNQHPASGTQNLELYAADGDDIRSSLDEERLDVGILLEPVETAKYDSLPLSSADRWGVVVRSDSPEAQHPTLTQDELVKLPLILPRRHIVIDTLHQWFSGGPEPLKIAGYHNLLTNALTLVKAGLGNLLCVEGSWTIRETPGFVFIPVSPGSAGSAPTRAEEKPPAFAHCGKFLGLCRGPLAIRRVRYAAVAEDLGTAKNH